ncbi:MAG: disulfide bond formation protein B [Methylocystis sp.]
MKNLKSLHVMALSLFFVSVCIILTAWFYESLGYLPCELCYKERLAYYSVFALIPLSYIFIIKNKFKTSSLIFYFITLLFILNFLLSIYHSGVELKYFAGPSDCSGALSNSFDFESFYKQLKDIKVVRCDQPNLWIIGLTLANWNIILSFILSVIALLAANKLRVSHTNSSS